MAWSNWRISLNHPYIIISIEITAIELGRFGIFLKIFLNLETVDKK